MGSQLTGFTAGSDMVVAFRAAYLKAIATAWDSDIYRYGDGKPFIPGGLCSHWNILNWSGLKKFLPGNFDCYEDTLVQTDEPQGVGYKPKEPGRKPNDFPWSLKMIVIDAFDEEIPKPIKNPDYYSVSYPVLAREITAGWAGGTDQIIIVIPPAPPDPNDYSAAVAGYLKQFPTILGYVEDNCQTQDTWRFEAAEPGFLEFTNLLAMALPYCWLNLPIRDYAGCGPFKPFPGGEKTFLEGLVTNKFGPNLPHPNPQAEKMLARYFGFKNPWEFDFVFLDANDINQALAGLSYEDVQQLPNPYRIWASQFFEWNNGHPEFKAIQWDHKLKRWHNLFNIVTMAMPLDPKINPSNIITENVYRANALAVYNHSISQYPFTCP